MKREFPTCEKIFDLHPEFSDLVRSRCPRCQGRGATCAIEYLRDSAGEPEVAEVPGEPSLPAQDAQQESTGG